MDREMLDAIQNLMQDMMGQMEGRLNTRIDDVKSSLTERIDGVEGSLIKRMDKLDSRMDTLEDQMLKLSEEARFFETKILVTIENEITNRLDALSEGYSLTHEKQKELERKTDSLQDQVNDLQTRQTALEEQTA